MTETNLSPALAAMVAFLTMPRQFSEIMSESVLRANEACKSTITRIDK